MVNTKTGVFVGIAIAVCIGVAFTASYSLVETSDSDKLDSVIDVTLEPTNPTIDDGALVGVKNENYAVNEDGKRHYSLVANTAPVVSP